MKQQREAREKMQLLVSAFSNSQQDQYEVFRRSSFPKSSVKKIMQVSQQEGVGEGMNHSEGCPGLPWIVPGWPQTIQSTYL